MSKLCSYCTKQLNDDAEVCTSCGSAITPPLTVTSKKKTKYIVIWAALFIVVVITAIMIISFKKNAYKYDGYKKTIDSLIKGIEEQSWNEYSKAYPKRLIGEIQGSWRFIKYGNGDNVLKKQFGKDIQLTYTFTEKNELSSGELNDLKSELEDVYDISTDNLNKAYRIKIDLTVNGKENKDFIDNEFIVGILDGKWRMLTLGSEWEDVLNPKGKLSNQFLDHRNYFQQGYRDDWTAVYDPEKFTSDTKSNLLFEAWPKDAEGSVYSIYKEDPNQMITTIYNVTERIVVEAGPMYLNSYFIKNNTPRENFVLLKDSNFEVMHLEMHNNIKFIKVSYTFTNNGEDWLGDAYVTLQSASHFFLVTWERKATIGEIYETQFRETIEDLFIA